MAEYVICVYSFLICFSAQEERKRRDEQIRETIMAKLVETGEKDR